MNIAYIFCTFRSTRKYKHSFRISAQNKALKIFHSVGQCNEYKKISRNQSGINIFFKDGLLYWPLLSDFSSNYVSNFVCADKN